VLCFYAYSGLFRDADATSRRAPPEPLRQPTLLPDPHRGEPPRPAPAERGDAVVVSVAVLGPDGAESAGPGSSCSLRRAAGDVGDTSGTTDDDGEFQTTVTLAPNSNSVELRVEVRPGRTSRSSRADVPGPPVRGREHRRRLERDLRRLGIGAWAASFTSREPCSAAPCRSMAGVRQSSPERSSAVRRRSRRGQHLVHGEREWRLRERLVATPIGRRQLDGLPRRESTGGGEHGRAK